MEASFGKRPATLVRRLIWELRVSHILEVRRRRRMFSGKAKMVRPSGMALSIQRARSGADWEYFSTISLRRVSASARLRALKMQAAHVAASL